jgi:hypothetical protein
MKRGSRHADMPCTLHMHLAHLQANRGRQQPASSSGSSLSSSSSSGTLEHAASPRGVLEEELCLDDCMCT